MIKPHSHVAWTLTSGECLAFARHCLWGYIFRLPETQIPQLTCILQTQQHDSPTSTVFISRLEPAGGT